MKVFIEDEILNKPLSTDLLLYEPHPHLVYTFNPIFADLNTIGFETPVNADLKKDDFRIFCVGGSTTGEGYPEYLEEYLKEEFPDVNIQVFNEGVPAWTSQETAINVLVRILDHNPDLIIVHHGINDVRPRSAPNFKGDYSHFRKVWSKDPLDRLQSHTLPLINVSYLYRILIRRFSEKWRHIDYYTDRKETYGKDLLDDPLEKETINPFIRNTLAIVGMGQKFGSKVLLTTVAFRKESEVAENHLRYSKYGIPEHNDAIREIAHTDNLPLVDIDAYMSGDHDYFTDLVHMDERGKKRKAKYIFEKIKNDKLLRKLPH